MLLTTARACGYNNGFDHALRQIAISLFCHGTGRFTPPLFVCILLMELTTWKLRHVPNTLLPRFPSGLRASAYSFFYPSSDDS
jgi:hypothetical protein